jgi:hypothetical protein
VRGGDREVARPSLTAAGFQPASGAEKRTNVSGRSGTVLLINNTLEAQTAETTGHTCPVFPAIPVRGVERACPPDSMLRHGDVSFGVREA